jgi:polyisoprenoid-binding protein YceI
MRLAVLTALVLAVPNVSVRAADANAPAPVPAGAYTVDKAHTSLIFRVNHMGFSHYTGRFTQVDARLQFDPAHIAASQVSVDIDPHSISADNAPSGFMQTLAGEAWLDADRFPQMSFRSKSVEVTGPNTFRIRGELTLHGVTRPLTLDARYNGGYAGHPMDPHARVGFSATGALKRSDFGISFGIPAPGTTMGVSDQVDVVLESEFSGPPLTQH